MKVIYSAVVNLINDKSTTAEQIVLTVTIITISDHLGIINKTKKAETYVVVAVLLLFSEILF